MTSRYYRLFDIIVNYYIKMITISYHIVSPFPGSIEYRPIPSVLEFTDIIMIFSDSLAHLW